jgi:hypothetical protein
MAYTIRAVALGADGKATMIFDRWVMRSDTLAQAMAEFATRRWPTEKLRPDALEMLNGDAVVLRRIVIGRNTYGPWLQA